MTSKYVGYHLAQLNIGRLVAPLESPEVAAFVGALEPINALADGAPGFVWRLQTDEGDATAVRAWDDERMLLNMSVWESIEALREFVYRSDHVEVMRRRREWFEQMAQVYMVLWWVPVGRVPTVDEAITRLAQLDALGPTADAFTFRESFPQPGLTGERHDGDRWTCGVS